MKFIPRVFFAFAFFFISFLHANAQSDLLNSQDLSDINIDHFTDEQIVAYYDKAIKSGLSENQLLKLAESKGLPDREIEKLKNRLAYLIKNQGVNLNDTSFERRVDSLRAPYDSAQFNIPRKKIKNEEEIFGSELFNSNTLVFEPNLRIPAPANYILGPDDEVVISVYGFSEKKYNLTVNELGEIYIPNVGPILVSGLTLENAAQEIKSKLAKTIYRNINSGQTKVQVTLGKIRSIRVTVIGQAHKPGNYTVSSLTTLYNILFLAGGPTDMGSYRNIEIIRGGQPKRAADLYDFLVDGDQKDNVLLQEGDVIRIPYYTNRVKLKGNVKREGKFEMKEGETFKDLLKYSGGFKDDAYRGAITLIRLTDSTKNILDVPFADFNQFQIKGSDEIIVRQLQDEFGNRLYISGSVLRPGPYQFSPGMTIKNLIEKAGGIKVDAYTKRATIFRYYRNKIPTILSVDLDSVLSMGQNIALQKDDSVSVHSIFEFKDPNFVSAEGNVRKAGPVQWRENITLRDVLLEVGGISEMGDSSNIEISRRIKNVEVGRTNHTESKSIFIDLTHDKAQDIHLQPFDMIYVKNLAGYTPQRSVLVLGEILSPGKYGLQKSGDKISDVIMRTGGFKASADSSSITIRRNITSTLTLDEREKLFRRILNLENDSLHSNQRLKDELYKTYTLISVDLNTALKKPQSSENLTLEDGDILTINRTSSLVKVSGEVYYPTVVPYKPNKTLKYYVEKAGSFMPYARKTGSLVIQPDGKVETVKHFLFFKSYPSVTPRSEIYVPQKQKNNRAKLGAGEWALVVSALGIVANVFLQAIKN